MCSSIKSYIRFWMLFTLIELLVVIAIISILAALLLPSLSRVRDKAYSINCGNDMRGCYLAVCEYVQDNNGLFINMFTINVPDSWRHTLLPYLKEMYPQIPIAGTGWAPEYMLYQKGKILKCSKGGNKSINFWMGYMYFVGYGCSGPRNPHTHTYRLFRLPKVSKQIIWTEGGATTVGPYVMPSSWPPKEYHPNGNNCVLGDGRLLTLPYFLIYRTAWIGSSKDVDEKYWLPCK